MDPRLPQPVLPPGYRSCSTVEECLDAGLRLPDATTLADAGNHRDVPAISADAPWANGRWRLQSFPFETRRPSRCGSATPLSNWSHAWRPRALCRNGRDFFMNSYGIVFRFDVSFESTTMVLHGSREQVPIGGAVVCAPSAVFAIAQTRAPDRSDALIRFDNADAEGYVLWHAQRGTPSHPAAAGGFEDSAATDTFVAWTHVQTDGIFRFYVANHRGENLHEVAPRLPDLPSRLHADGERLVFEANDDIWLYTPSTRSLENLTRDSAQQTDPFLSGNRLVWIDQRHETRPGTWNNPEVYTMDLRDRIVQRVTHDPPDRPVVQSEVSTNGRWIVWNDLRDSHRPAERDALFTSKIYAFDTTTGREHPIAVDHTGPMGRPIFIDDQVYFTCATIVRAVVGFTTFDGGLYRNRLPVVATP